MIGKGKRDAAVKEAVVRNGAVYTAALGGAGALMCQCVKTLEIIAPKDPPPGFKKPTEMATLAILDADDELTKLRRERDTKAAIMYVAKAEFIAPDSEQ